MATTRLLETFHTLYPIQSAERTKPRDSMSDGNGPVQHQQQGRQVGQCTAARVTELQ